MNKKIKLRQDETICRDHANQPVEVFAATQDRGEKGVAIALLSGPGTRRDADINVYLCRMEDGRLDVVARDNASDWGVIADYPDRAAEVAGTVDLDDVEAAIRKIANGRAEYVDIADLIKETAELAATIEV